MELASMFVIRIVVPEDEPAAKAVTETAFEPVRAIYKPKKPTAAEASQIRLVAVRDGEIIGVVSCMPKPGRLHLMGLATHPAHQRRGVARALIDHAETIARAVGLPQLSLYTVKETGNVPVFVRLGFRIVSEQPDQWSESPDGRPLTEAYMERPVGRGRPDSAAKPSPA
jgi:ribosomal protein S18 acetylase RimI-like enzyme